jgi:hypothetical protein
LEIGLKPHDPNGGNLQMVADLNTAEKSIWVLSVGASKSIDTKQCR